MQPSDLNHWRLNVQIMQSPQIQHLNKSLATRDATTKILLPLYCCLLFYGSLVEFIGLWCFMSLSTIFQLYHGGQVEETRVSGENHQPVASH